jgi:hypothetical protein
MELASEFRCAVAIMRDKATRGVCVLCSQRITFVQMGTVFVNRAPVLADAICFSSLISQLLFFRLQCRRLSLAVTQCEMSQGLRELCRRKRVLNVNSAYVSA